MNPFASVTFAWTMVYAFLLVNFLFLGLFRRAPGDGWRYGALLALNFLYDLESITRYGDHPAATMVGERLRIAAGLLALPLAIDLARRFRAASTGRWQAAMYGWFALLAVLIASGAVERGDELVTRVIVGPRSIVYRQAVLTHAGLALLIPTVLVSVVAGAVEHVRAARRSGRWIWAVAFSNVVLGGCIVHDLLCGVLRLPSPFLVEHASFLYVGALSLAFAARLTEEFTRRDDELARVRHALQEREALAAIGELSAIVAHEVRNPLAVITNAAASLRRPELPRREQDLLLGILEEEAGRINHIVTDLLTLARPLHPVLRDAEPRELIERCLGPAERAGTEVTLRSEPDAESVLRCDAQLLRHALENVIENAVQAMGTGGSLVIVLARRERQGVAGREIAVIDSGEGMNTEVRSNARKAFFTTRTTGTGLGLAIVDRIMGAHRGAVEIDSRRGEGTTVRLFVPDAS